MGFAVAAVDMAERIGLVEYLDTHLPWDPQQCRVSPGTRLLALMVTFLVDPRALYRIPEFYTELDCAVLFGAERQPADFNDDAMGRALEKLFESQASQIHTGLCTQAVERLGLDPTPQLHCDTTSLTLMGQYPDPGAGSQPAYGHNKDGHADCKQLVVGVVARTDGLPYAVDVCDGHRDDPTWSRQAVLHTGSALAADVRATLLFVADSKLVSQNTVEDLCEADIRFVSRLPNLWVGTDDQSPSPETGAMGEGRSVRAGKGCHNLPTPGAPGHDSGPIGPAPGRPLVCPRSQSRPLGSEGVRHRGHPDR